MIAVWLEPRPRPTLSALIWSQYASISTTYQKLRPVSSQPLPPAEHLRVMFSAGTASFSTRHPPTVADTFLCTRNKRRRTQQHDMWKKHQCSQIPLCFFKCLQLHRLNTRSTVSCDFSWMLHICTHYTGVPQRIWTSWKCSRSSLSTIKWDKNTSLQLR